HHCLLALHSFPTRRSSDLKALRDLLPNENISYLGDTARVPYGPKSPETVQRYAIELAEMLMKKNAKALVVACNTVSSVALPTLRSEEHTSELQSPCNLVCR